MTAYSEIAGLDTTARAAWAAWQDTTLDVGAHLLDCRSGCDGLTARCPAGSLLAEEERARWGQWDAARKAGGAA